MCLRLGTPWLAGQPNGLHNQSSNSISMAAPTPPSFVDYTSLPILCVLMIVWLDRKRAHRCPFKMFMKEGLKNILKKSFSDTWDVL